MDDPDFDDGSDLVTYRVQLPRVEAVRVSAKLKYQSLAFGFLADLSLDAQDPTVSRFLDMYAESPERGETIAEADANAVQINDGDGSGTGDGSDSGTGDGSGAGDGSGTGDGSGAGDAAAPAMVATAAPAMVATAAPAMGAAPVTAAARQW